MEAPVVVHEAPGRLRLKAPFLQRPRLDADHLVGLIAEIDGVRSVRINIVAESIIVEYDGTPPARRAIVSRLSSIAPNELRARETPSEGEPSLGPLALRMAFLLAIPLLPAHAGRPTGSAFPDAALQANALARA